MLKERIEELTNREIEKLNSLTIGHGKLTDASEITGLHVHTLRNIRRLGYGKPETISIIRKKLFSKTKNKLMVN